MAWIGGLVAGAVGLIGSALSSDSAGDAAATQADASKYAADVQWRQFEAVQKLLQPFVDVGTDALSAQRALVGLDGADAQAKAIAALQSSPQFTALRDQGEQSILARASATGGLRGGNVQGALAQFSPSLLSALISDQYGRLGGLTTMGQNSAAGVGTAGLQTGSQVAQLLQQQGAALAGGQLAQGQIWGNAIGQVGGLAASAMRPQNSYGAGGTGGSWGWTGMEWAF